MRHRKSNVKLGRTASHRKAMLRNMATSLFEHETIKTTVAKGKALKPVIDRLITLAKRGDLAARRAVAAVLTSPVITKKLFATANARFGNRTSGYTLMARLGLRYGDNAPICVLSLVTAATTKATKVSPSKPSDRSRRVAASRLALDGKQAEAATPDQVEVTENQGSASPEAATPEPTVESTEGSSESNAEAPSDDEGSAEKN